MSKWIKNWFSNMLKCDTPIYDMDGVEYKTVENYYQAAKSTSIEEKKNIANMPPYDSKKYGRSLLVRPDWDGIKLSVMIKASRQKYAIGTSWREKLDATTDPIVETNNWHDNYWGDCICDRCDIIAGQNYLGRILTLIRDNKNK